MVSALLVSLVIAPTLCLGVDIYKPNPGTTAKGCTCIEDCTTNLAFHCAAAPFCKVEKNDCPGADWSIIMFSHYDYCVYQPHDDYEQLTAEQKQTLILDQVAASTGTGSFPSLLDVFGGINLESVRTTFEASADIFPEKRTKYIHSVGVTGGIRFESTGDHQYTGLFKGAEHGIVRFSSAKSPEGGVAPGMGIKFLRDGVPSANFVAMYSLDGQTCEEENFFQHEWNNHIPMTTNFGLQLVARKFWQASMCPLQVGLSDLAKSDGETPNFPYKLSFKSDLDVHCPCGTPEQYVTTCLANLAEKVETGKKIFDVFATPAPGSEGDKTKIGEIILTSVLKTSTFGDEKLFFRHQHMEEDFKLKEEWLNAIDKKSECGMKGVTTEKPPLTSGCANYLTRSDDGMLNTDCGSLSGSNVRHVGWMLSVFIGNLLLSMM